MQYPPVGRILSSKHARFGINHVALESISNSGGNVAGAWPAEAPNMASNILVHMVCDQA